MKKNVLAIESASGNFQALSRFLEKLNLNALWTPRLGEIDAILESDQAICLAIIDVNGFDDHIWERCRELKMKNVPMLIISPGNDSKAVRFGYDYGAKGVFKKPVLMKELAHCIESILFQD